MTFDEEQPLEKISMLRARAEDLLTAAAAQQGEVRSAMIVHAAELQSEAAALELQLGQATRQRTPMPRVDPSVPT